MTTPTLDAATTRQLAIIRLLYQQGVEQAARPEPLSVFSLLTFHDSVELFLVLAADHLGAQMPQRDPNFLDYWHLLRPTEAFPAGVHLTGRGRMDRLNRNRNALKHAGALPSRGAVDDALASTASFFEDNTTAVFGVAFDAIDMADVVPQEEIRKLLKAAAAAEGTGNRREAMAALGWAFEKLFTPYARRPHSPYGFGGRMRRFSTGTDGVEAELRTLAKDAGSRRSGNVHHAGRAIDHNIGRLNTAVSAIQTGMQVMALGIDFGRYTRFVQLTPAVSGDEQQPLMIVDHDYAPNREECDYCVQFVISVALRVAEVDANAVMPSWERVRLAGQKVGREMLKPPDV